MYGHYSFRITILSSNTYIVINYGHFDECLRQIRGLSRVYTQLKDEQGKNEYFNIYFIKLHSGDKKRSIKWQSMFFNFVLRGKWWLISMFDSDVKQNKKGFKKRVIWRSLNGKIYKHSENTLNLSNNFKGTKDSEIVQFSRHWLVAILREYLALHNFTILMYFYSK